MNSLDWWERLGFPAAITATLLYALFKGGGWLGVEVLLPLRQRHEQFLTRTEELLGAHIAVEIGQAEADRALFLTLELGVELVGAREAEADEAGEAVVGGEAQDAAVRAFLHGLAEGGGQDKTTLVASGRKGLSTISSETRH